MYLKLPVFSQFLGFRPRNSLAISGDTIVDVTGDCDEADSHGNRRGIDHQCLSQEGFVTVTPVS